MFFYSNFNYDDLTKNMDLILEIGILLRFKTDQICRYILTISNLNNKINNNNNIEFKIKGGLMEKSKDNKNNKGLMIIIDQSYEEFLEMKEMFEKKYLDLNNVRIYKYYSIAPLISSDIPIIIGYLPNLSLEATFKNYDILKKKLNYLIITILISMILKKKKLNRLKKMKRKKNRKIYFRR